ncbi:MAG: toxic anion resistance protein [Desulfamplus sp.]|nr:toxic anion resistance protein [Desulfamplus sp.]
MSSTNLPVLNLTDQTKSSMILRLEEQSPDKLAMAQNMASQLDFSNSQSVLAFGVKDQKNMVTFTDSVLSHIRSGDAGPVGELMSDLKGKILDLDVGSLPRSAGSAASNAVSYIPIVGGWLAAKLDSARAFLRRYETLKVQIDDITKHLESEKSTQLEHLNRLDTLYDRNQEYFDSLEILIAAGEIKLNEMQAEFERRRAQLEQMESTDPMDLQKLKDFGDTIQSLDRRVYNLKLARTSAVTSGPTIRIAQEGSKSIVEMIQESILMMVPEWKKQLVIAISLFDQKKAMLLVNETRSMTNELMNSTAALLGETQSSIKQAQGEGFVKVETLQNMTEKLISTIDSGIKMDAENRQKRAEGLQKLADAEAKLKDALKSAQASAI